jgi:hypothetical protein
MARPVVLVYQEFATVTTTPDTPELNCLVAGPAYWIQDYLDDKASIQTASDYGTQDADNPYTAPAAFTDAITVADPPNNVTGGVLDSASVKVFLDNARVLIGQDVTTGATVPSTGLPHNKIDCSGADAAFITAMADMQAGDYVIIDDPTGATTDAVVKRITVVDTTGGNEAIYTNTNFTASVAAAEYIRVEREVDDIEVGSSFVVVTGNQIVVQGGITTVLTGEVAARVVNYAEVYIEYRSLRTDLRSVDTVESRTEIISKIGKIDSRNPLAGVCATALANTTTVIQFFGVNSDDATGHDEVLEVIEGRDDIYAIVPITVSASIIAQYKTAVESLASVTLAETTGIPQKFRVVLGAQNLVEDEVISGPYAGAGQHLTVDGAIAGTPIVTADPINVFADEGATWVTDGVRAGDTLVIASDATREGSYTVAEVYGERRLRITGVFPGIVTTACAYYIIRGTGTPVGSTTFTGGTVTAATRTVVATVGGVTGLISDPGKVLRITAATPATNVGDWLIDAMTVPGPPAQWTVVETNTPSLVDATGVAGSLFAPISAVYVARTCASRRCFRRIVDNNATFTTDLVKATDTLQVPNPQTGTNYTTNAPYEYTVAYIPNENEVVLDTNEDVIAQDSEVGDTNLNFRINRELTKDDQIDALVSVAQSFDSRRVVLVWPDSADINGLVDGSKTRTVSSTAEAADPQPGYYLAGAVGGLTAGLPSHQGFTNIAIAGVDRLYNSTRYFSDTQLTELSDGGWFVYEQETPTALPSCIHQLTTDPDTLESGEYSIVKNFDFVSIFFQDILNDYLGIYNINTETMSLLKQSLNTGIDLLKLRSFAKIGAPLNAASITNIQISTAAADRVEVNMSVELPKPLNRIGLHLLSN